MGGAIWNSTRNKNAYKYEIEKCNDKEASRKLTKKRNI